MDSTGKAEEEMPIASNTSRPADGRTRFRWLAATASLALVGTAAYLWMAEEALAKQVVVGANVPAGERISFDQIDHTPWTKLLETYVDEEGMVNYSTWLGTPEDVARLDAYLAHLSSGDSDAESSREATLAFWINAYNAVTVKGILREYPTASIKDHTPLVGYNIWKHLLLQVGDQQISLNDIEHEVLRKMKEPRIHFAIVCASIGCPRLLNEAYTAETLDEQLTANARNFFTQNRNFLIDGRSNSVHLSSILKWFAEDFGKNSAAQIKTISPFLPNDQARHVISSPGVQVEFLEYDWNLNEQTESR
ncbi:MAG: DUF547 domain-containing protein [Aeoliella sp.]